MSIVLTAVSAVLAGASLFDGITTVRFLKHTSYEEVTTAFLFGKRPSTLKVYGLGGLVIASEIAVALIANHFSVWAGYAVAAVLTYQIYTHVHQGIGNLKIPV